MKAYKTEILCVGTELLLGDVVNTNAATVARALKEIGIGVYWTTVVGDNPERLRKAVEIARSRADILITTGGLGPTYDDLTKEIVCETMGAELVLYPEELDYIRDYFVNTGRVMPENNVKQALLPPGCTVFHNYNGTAPGCGFQAEGKHVLLFPGPPRELKMMLETGGIPYLRQLSDEILVSRDIRIFGIGESALENSMRPYMESLTNPTLAPYAGTAEVRLRIAAMAKSEAEGQAMAEPVAAHVREALGDLIYSETDPSLEALCLRLLTEQHKTFAAAESCTGGLIAKRITDLSGASAVFMGGIVSYTNYVKAQVLGVRPETLDAFGAVSRETAIEMARGARARCGSDLAVSVTGCAGPNSDERGTPVGTGFVGFAAEDREFVLPIQMGNDREWARVYASSCAFDLIRRYLQGMDWPKGIE